MITAISLLPSKFIYSHDSKSLSQRPAVGEYAELTSELLSLEEGVAEAQRLSLALVNVEGGTTPRCRPGSTLEGTGDLMLLK